MARGNELSPVHDYEKRWWHHFKHCQLWTIIVSWTPVVERPTHGTNTVAGTWAEKYAHFMRLFERLDMEVVLECSIAVPARSWASVGMKPMELDTGP